MRVAGFFRELTDDFRGKCTIACAATIGGSELGVVGKQAVEDGREGGVGDQGERNELVLAESVV